MSELNAITSGDIYNIIEYEDCFRTDDLYYPKAEADKVLTELEIKLATVQQVLRFNQPEALFSNLETMGRLRHELDELRRKYELALATIKEYKNDIANLNEKLAEVQHDTNNCNMA